MLYFQLKKLNFKEKENGFYIKISTLNINGKLNGEWT